MKTLQIGQSFSQRNKTPNPPEIEPGVFQAIACSFHMFQFEGPLLPNLRQIYCQNIKEDMLWDIYSSLSSKLERFQLSIEEPFGLATMTILSALGIKSPRIQCFIIEDGLFCADELAPHISTSICGLLHLHTFDCSHVPLTQAAIFHLASLPNLRDANIHVPDRQTDIKPSFNIPFPALQFLALNSDSIISSIEFVKNFIQSASLESFTIYVEDPPSSAQLGQMFSTLLAHTSPECLTSFDAYHADYISLDDGASPLLRAHDFDALMKFKSLESITIETDCSTEDLDDSLLETMANSWPNLVHLALTNCWSKNPPSQCTLRGILHLVRSCPNLLSLAIAFQASTETSWNGRPGGGVVNEHMKELVVGRSPMTDPHALASFLSDVFPNLISIIAWDNYNPDVPIEVRNWNLWQETVQLVQSSVAIRGMTCCEHGWEMGLR